MVHFHIHLRITALSACLEALLGFSLEGSFCLTLTALLPWCWQQEQTSKETPTLGSSLRCLSVFSGNNLNEAFNIVWIIDWRLMDPFFHDLRMPQGPEFNTIVSYFISSLGETPSC